MQNQSTTSKKEKAIQRLSTARGNLLLMVALTALNVVLAAFGSSGMLLFSATIPYFAALFGIWGDMMGAGIIFAAVLLLPYLLCWIFSKKHYGWMIAASVFFMLDSIFMALLYISAADISGILDVLIHLWVLYYLFLGVNAGYTLKHLPPEENDECTAAQAVESTGSTIPEAGAPLYRADNEVKARILLEGDFEGRNVCYRRVKRTNELVIDGYVYDTVEMLAETPHQLSAILNGHTFAAGYDGSHSYISVDGQQVARKIRLF